MSASANPPAALATSPAAAHADAVPIAASAPATPAAPTTPRKRARKPRRPNVWERAKMKIKPGKAFTNGKVDHAPLTARERKLAAKFTVGYDLRKLEWRAQRSYDLRRIKQRIKKMNRAADAAAKTKKAAVRAVAATPTRTATPDALAMPGALPDDTATAVEAPVETEADDENPSLVVTLFKLTFAVVGALVKRKRTDTDTDDEAEARDLKRRRVETYGLSPSRASERPIAGSPARNARTGATALSHTILTATAAPSAARKPPVKLKATLSKCPPPSPIRTAPVAGKDKPRALPGTVARDATHARDVAQPSAPATSASRTTALLREAPTLIDLGVPSAAPRVAPAHPGMMALSRQAAFLNLSSATPASSSATRTTALLREAPTVIDLGVASAAPGVAPAHPGMMALSRQPAFVNLSSATPATSSGSSSATRTAATALLREAPTIIDLGVASTAAPRAAPAHPGMMALSRQPAFIFDFSATPAASSSTTRTTTTALLREAPTVIDFGTAPTPSSSSSGLSRQPAVIFHFGTGAPAESSSSASGSSSSSSASREGTRRGKRSGARAEKKAHRKDKDEDKDDGAARA